MPADVRLKPLFGLEPKSWLTGIYGLLLAGILLGMAFGPALASPGTLVSVTSVPPGARVEWNGKDWGVTPLTAFFPPGTSSLVVRRPGFVPSVHAFTSDGSALRSFVVRHHEDVSVRLVPRSTSSVEEEATIAIGRWAMTAPADEQHPIPPLFVPLVADLTATGATPEAIRIILRGLRSQVADHDLYVDYGRAWGLWKDHPPASFQAQSDLWDGVLNPGTHSALRVFWILACQPQTVRDRIVSSGDAEFQAAKESWHTATATQPEDLPPPAPVPVSTSMGLFRGIAAGWSYWGQASSATSLPTQDPWRIPVLTENHQFWLAEAPVTEAQLASFFLVHPEWKASDGILSWNGSQAYLAWLNSQPGRPAGLRYTLPSEQEWEVAMRTNPTLWASVRGRWEWTASAWGPADYLVAGDGDPASETPSFARTAKGGRAFWGRAGLPAHHVSPTLSLRLALKSSTPEITP